MSGRAVAEILTICDELLRGEIVDTNTAFLSGRLLGIDIDCNYHTSVRDSPAAMADAFRRASTRSDIVLVILRLIGSICTLSISEPVDNR